MTDRTDPPRLRPASEVVDEMSNCRARLGHMSVSDVLERCETIIHQRDLAVAEASIASVLRIIDACRWTGWDDRKRLRVIEEMILALDLPELLRRATEVPAEGRTTKEPKTDG